MNKDNELKVLLLCGLDTIKKHNFAQFTLFGDNPLPFIIREDAREKAENEEKAKKLYQSFIAECLNGDILKQWALTNKNELEKFSNHFIKDYFDNIF